MNEFDYKNLSPFKWYVLENYPFIEADFDATSEWQLLCKLGNEINKVIDSTNILGGQVESLTTYVMNYFENLDIQSEVDNKLNEMAESGELEELIAQYLNSVSIIAFNTVNDMKGGQSFVNGSIAKTLGETTYNDGNGAFYKIRTLTSDDTIDGVNIIALTNFNNLIAELIPYTKMKSVIQAIPTNERNAIYIGNSYINGVGSDSRHRWYI